MNHDEIFAEFKRGNESLAAAKLLADAELFNDAMSRAYYAVLHYVRSLLFTEDIVPRSHHGAFVHFSKHFVKTGRMSPDFNRILGRLQKLREEADYMTGSKFCAEDIASVLESVREFQMNAKELLVKQGIVCE